MSESTPRAPRGTGNAGKRLWNSVVEDYDLDQHELSLLGEAARVTDRLDALNAVLATEGVMSPAGDGKVHPALVEARQQEITLARLLAALRMPSGEEGDQQASARPQRRGGARGAYGIRGAVS
ncbi:hypothetical protein CLV30_11766 [Haloactinopolyspora alba]|uniref:Terminase small subunit n=1 Tax=Haloactinopolyspora alba TaxID=648780 RepID=A0A2P8DRC0_9ACTN|nr:terminase [Haloactinopolyspora alba]PSK99763.1 hypothetical protein CLV30_11766 [Haloactinopolyspora alba]